MCSERKKFKKNKREKQKSKNLWFGQFHSVAYYIRKKCVRMKPVAVVETQSSRAIVSVLWSNSYLWRANVSCDCVYLFVIVSSSSFRWCFPCSHMLTYGRKRSGVRSSSGSIYALHFQLNSSSRMRIFLRFCFCTNCRKEGITAITSAKQIQTPVSLFY